MTPRRVALTGRGVVSPLGVGVTAHSDGVRAGRSALGPVERLVRLGLGASRGGAVSAEVLKPHLGRLARKQQKFYNRTTLLAMLAASLAMEDAGLGPGAGDPARFGVLLGVNQLAWDLDAMTEYLAASESAESPGALDMARANGYCMRQINPLDFSLKTLPNLTAGHVAIAHDAQGFCRAMTEGSVGGARAVGDACRLISEGDLEVALCGGADAQLEELLFATHRGLGILESDDGSGLGTVAGEGAGLLVLEEAEHAEARGAPVHGAVVGFASAAGEGRLAHEDDAGRLAERIAGVIDAVVAEAGAVPGAVSLHGDGLPVHDRAEALALARVFGDRAERLPRLAMKPLHGDLGAASTPVELLACSAALEQATLPLGDVLVLSLGLFGECSALVFRGVGGGRAD